jgi:hypothetical protein
MIERYTREQMGKIWSDEYRFRKQLDVELAVHASHYDQADPVHWWRRRADARFVLFETEKYVWYLVRGD